MCRTLLGHGTLMRANRSMLASNTLRRRMVHCPFRCRVPELFPEVQTEFASVADGWVMAYAKVNDRTVVTDEEYDSEAKKRVPMPNVCLEFDVLYTNTYRMPFGPGSGAPRVSVPAKLPSGCLTGQDRAGQVDGDLPTRLGVKVSACWPSAN